MPLKRVVRRRRVGGRKRVVRRVMGRGLMDMYNKAKEHLKKNKTISRFALSMGHPNVARFARSQGYGRRRRVRRSGGGIWDTLKDAYDYVKDNRLISKGANALGYTNIGRFARSQGFGRRRRMRRVGGRVVFPAVYTTGLGGLSATTA